jgi:hypothetical protein
MSTPSHVLLWRGPSTAVPEVVWQVVWMD